MKGDKLEALTGMFFTILLFAIGVVSLEKSFYHVDPSEPIERIEGGFCIDTSFCKIEYKKTTVCPKFSNRVHDILK
jgi:hypothetical protein